MSWLQDYVERAMGTALYDKLEDATFIVSIPDCPGAIAFGETLHECRGQLRSVLERSATLRARAGGTSPKDPLGDGGACRPFQQAPGSPDLTAARGEPLVLPQDRTGGPRVDRKPAGPRGQDVRDA